MNHYLIQKISKLALTAITTILLTLTAVLALNSTTSAQQLENAAECGADIQLNVSADCKQPKTANEVEACKQRTPGSEADKTAACNPESSIESLVKTIINVFSAIVGSIAVIMIIIGGFKYVTSGGDSNSVGSAKNTILYAIVGLVIVVFAQIIVRFVLQRI